MIEFFVGTTALLSISTIALTVSLIQTRSKNKRLAERVANLDEAANESYTKFIRDSRDWAYEYIEEVQDKLRQFASRVEPQIEYYITYGQVVPGPHLILVKEISDAYEDLKTIMPQENEENK